ncbi:hypothetical protein CPB83DRAFT_834059 [Crepidotus variabilis]|uniref:Uncharacterized protein n=1 Tax=Crepidotus variabilis TaxID=179855 RepID=A0A9P6ELB7_9AGAR|nr:hypothetical protein CPB83DRAFT_834059 [Crepidotus variabilis]
MSPWTSSFHSAVVLSRRGSVFCLDYHYIWFDMRYNQISVISCGILTQKIIVAQLPKTMYLQASQGQALWETSEAVSQTPGTTFNLPRFKLGTSAATEYILTLDWTTLIWLSQLKRVTGAMWNHKAGRLFLIMSRQNFKFKQVKHFNSLAPNQAFT